MKRFWLWMLVLLMILGLATTAWMVAKSQNHMLDSDFFTFWLGGKMVGQGQNPFDPVQWKNGHELAGSTWLENLIYCYPLPLAYLTLPIGAMPIGLAAPLWLFLSASSIVLAILIIQSRRKGGLWVSRLFPVLLGLAVFRPVLTTIRNGQLGGFFLLTIAAVLFFAEKKKWVIAGLLSGLLYLKPTLGLPILGLLFIWFHKNRGMKGILTNIIMAGTVIIVSVIHQPGWIASFFSIGTQKGSTVFMSTPTIWGIAGKLCSLNSGCTQIVGIVIFILIVLAAIVLYWRYSARMDIWLAGSIAVLISLMITPYLWAYDQVLLILPIVFITNQLTRIKTSYIVVSLLPLLFSIVSLLLLFVALHTGNDVGSVFLTIFTAGVLTWSEIRIRNSEHGIYAS